jgi:hypothetical protein
MPEDAGEKDRGAAKRVAAWVTVGLGIVANIVGIAGAIGDWGGSTTKVVIGAAPAGAVTPTSTPGPTTPGASTPTPTATVPVQQTPQQFLVALGQAESNGDVDFLIAHLHPVVLQRYGEAACRTFFTNTKQPTTYKVTGQPSAAGPYVYSSDGKIATVRPVISVPVTVTAGTQTANAVVHLAPLGGSYRIFADCGTPTG